MEVLLLNAPIPDAFDNPTVERNPRKLGEWLDQLPPLNPAESVAQLLEVLAPFNRQPMPDKERLRLLELYRQAVNAVFNAFTQRSLRQLPVPAEQRERIKQDVSRLCLELAGGYKGLVLQGHRQGRSPAQDSLLVQAAYGAMEQLAHALLHSFRIYGPIPPRAFLELHQLYAWAEQGGALDAPVELAGVNETLGGLYRRILLLCCAEPARLNEDEVLRLHVLLEKYATRCRILTGPCEQPYEGRFVLDLRADTPPRPCAKFAALGGQVQARVLDARAVTEALRASSQGGQTADEERYLLRTLLPQLEATPQRAAARHAVLRPALVATGIAAIHYYLSDSRHLAQAVAQAGQGIVVHEADSADAGLESWNIGNESDTGYQLHCAQRRPTARVGELLGVLPRERGGAPAGLELVVVRWLRNGADGSIEAGVERIAGAAAAVQCLPAEGGETPPVPCLFLPSSSLHDTPATLLTPKRLYARGKSLRLAVSGKSVDVEAGYLIMDTACFDRFALQKGL